MAFVSRCEIIVRVPICPPRRYASRHPTPVGRLRSRSSAVPRIVSLWTRRDILPGLSPGTQSNQTALCPRLDKFTRSTRSTIWNRFFRNCVVVTFTTKATQWEMKDLPVAEDWEREVWLWDFGGQADQRLIHQLYVDKTALSGGVSGRLGSDPEHDLDFYLLARWAKNRGTRAGRCTAGSLREGIA